MFHDLSTGPSINILHVLANTTNLRVWNFLVQNY